MLFSHAYGLADRRRRIPNTLRTRFRIGSMNKMFTAVAILQLVEAGKVKLTAPLGTYLPDYPNRDVATKVTIHQLLTHTGGTGDIFGPDFDAHRNQLRTLSDYVKLYGKRGPEFKPGSQWAYSNYGFILLGAVIEKVTGHSYYDYVQQHIYAPAGMTRSGSLPEDQAVPDRSIGYTKASGTTAWTPNTDTLPYRGTSAVAATRPSRTSHDSPTPCSATNCSARRHQAAHHRKSDGRPRRQVRLRLRRRPRPRRQRLGRPRRRRTRHQRRPEDLPEIRLRGRRAREPRPASSTANLGVPRPPTADKAVAPRGGRAGSRGCDPESPCNSDTAMINSPTRSSLLLSCRKRASASLGVRRPLRTTTRSPTRSPTCARFRRVLRSSTTTPAPRSQVVLSGHVVRPNRAAFFHTTPKGRHWTQDVVVPGNRRNPDTETGPRTWWRESAEPMLKLIDRQPTKAMSGR